MSQVVVDGWTCPLVNCGETEVHAHECCDECGAMEFLNIACMRCRNHWVEDGTDNDVVRELFDAFHYAWGRADKKVRDGHL